MNRYLPMLFPVLLAIVACSSASRGASPTPSPADVPASAASVANGRAIFLTGRDSSGQRVHAQPRAMLPNCAACHRPNGSGGVSLPGGAVSADLRYGALVRRQRHPYTLGLLERAISSGIDDDGQRLDPIMPHWKMSKRDLHDVAYYVLTRLR
ncbi:MAG: c-type cytochrome [Candidatus Tyrphobacter sp.]